MSKKPLYIELLTYLNDNQHVEEWIDLAGHFRQKLSTPEFYANFKEEINFLSGNTDILLKGNLAENPEAAHLVLFAQITEGGKDYLRSYKFAKEDNRDKFSNKQIMLLMFSIIASTVLLAFALAYFFG